MADLSNGTTIGGFRLLHENLLKPTLFDKLVIEKHGPYNVWKYADIGDNNVSLELGLRDGSGSGSIRLNSYYANEFCFIRPSDGNLHIDSSNGRYYFNLDPTSNGGANGSIYLGTASGTNGVALNAVGTSYFYGGGLSISGNTSITGTLNVSSTITGSLSGNASTLTKLQTARTISLTGGVTGSTTFDGSLNVSITATVANDSHTHDTRYYTESEADSRFVNVTGDTVTGDLNISNYGNTLNLHPHSAGIDLYSTGNFAPHYQTNFSLYTGIPSSGVKRFNVDSSGNTWIGGTLSVSGAITGSLSGNASTLTKLQTARTISLAGDVTGSTTFDGSLNVSITTTVANDSHTHDTRYYTESEADSRFVNASGDTMTGSLIMGGTNPHIKFQPSGANDFLGIRFNYTNNDGTLEFWTSDDYNEGFYWNSYDVGSEGTGTKQEWMRLVSKNLYVLNNITATKVYGAVYNDYAEYRSSTEPIDFGFVLIEDENGNVIKCNEDRSKKILGVSSDTLGFLIGKQEDTDTPIAAAGRVLVYLVDKHKLKIGDLVCSTKEGKVRKMKWWEKIFFPELIVGYVSEFPSYDVWGSDNINVNGRIWIRI